jgi:hypothetical protein
MNYSISFMIILTLGLTISPLAHATYTRATSPPVTVSQIYSNELGSPFVTFSSNINSACAGSNSLYLYDQTQSPGNTEYQNNKLALLLTAEAEGKSVILDYYYDSTVSGWAACFIEGITLVN